MTLNDVMTADPRYLCISWASCRDEDCHWTISWTFCYKWNRFKMYYSITSPQILIFLQFFWWFFLSHRVCCQYTCCKSLMTLSIRHHSAYGTWPGWLSLSQMRIAITTI